jgi:hypothetical protein
MAARARSKAIISSSPGVLTPFRPAQSLKKLIIDGSQSIRVP